MLIHSTKNIVLMLIFIAIVIGGIFLVHKKPQTDQVAPGVVCTMEAKLCPDGSYVGRSGPLCEFSACPQSSDTSSWKTFSDPTKGLTFKYPESIGTTYIHTVDWPPKVELTAGPFTCTVAGKETETAGQTTKKTINGRQYCITKESEGAAGSIYTQYAYLRESQNKIAIFTFSLRAVQCGNYDQPEMSACEAERTAFNIDPLVDQIAQTLDLK